jgi:hypothetical protein
MCGRRKYIVIWALVGCAVPVACGIFGFVFFTARSAVVTSLEYLDRPTFKESLVALVCHEYDPQEADVYAILCPPGTVVSVND